MRPTINNINSSSIVDWIELCVAMEGFFSKDDILGTFTDITGDEVDNIVFCLSKRLFIYGNIAPYKVTDVGIEKNDDVPELIQNVYIFFLFLSVYGNVFDTNNAAKIFERVSSEAFSKYLGGESYVFGFPDGNSGNLNQKITELSSFIGEKRGGQSPLINAKDEKLDLVSIKKIDERFGKIMIFGQCASGRNRVNKLTELSIDSWTHYINYGVDPIRGFSCPYFIDDTEDMYHYCRRGGLVFDRGRLFNFISLVDHYRDINLEQEIIDRNESAKSNYSEGDI